MKKCSVKNYMKKAAIMLFALTFIITQTGCMSNSQNEAANQGVSKTGFYLDTVCSVTIYGLRDDDGRLAAMSKEELERECFLIITDAFKVCAEYEKKLSKTIAGSDIDRINRSGGNPVTATDETIELVKKGIEFGELSEGAFDITVGKATDLWDFHKDSDGGYKGGTIPSAESLKKAVSHVNYRNIEIEPNEIRLSDPDTEINLGGIAKGYIADKVAEYLESRGVVSAIVDLGGNIVALGGKSSSLVLSADDDAAIIGEQTEFKVGIQDPAAEDGSL